MNQDKKQTQEYVEAVPGPAIVISKKLTRKCKKTTIQNIIKKQLKEY